MKSGEQAVVREAWNLAAGVGIISRHCAVIMLPQYFMFLHSSPGLCHKAAFAFLCFHLILESQTESVGTALSVTAVASVQSLRKQ